MVQVGIVVVQRHHFQAVESLLRFKVQPGRVVDSELAGQPLDGENTAVVPFRDRVRNGVGRIDMVENRFVGSRGTPKLPETSTPFAVVVPSK